MKDKFYNEVSNLTGANIEKFISIQNNNHLRVKAIFKYKIIINDCMNIKKVFMLIGKYKKKYFILGNGSNVLFKKTYYNEVLIQLDLKKSNSLSIVNAGEKINNLNYVYAKKGISSFNFLVGVPCSLGGAIYMNAGAFNHSISQIIEYVYAFDLNTYSFQVLDNKQCEFSYRDSHFKHSDLLIVGAKIKLMYTEISKLEKETLEYLKIRNQKLPLESPNLGSVFKNPSGYYAGSLIENTGLKGYKYKKFMVSNKHANVIINIGDYKGKHMLILIKKIRRKVYKKHKVKLDLEVIVK